MTGRDANLWIMFSWLDDLRGRIEQPGHVFGVPSLVRGRYAADVLCLGLEAGRFGSARGFGRWFIGVIFGLFVQIGHGLAHDRKVGIED